MTDKTPPAQTGEPTPERLQWIAALLRSFAEYGMDAKFSDGSRTPNSERAEEAADLVETLLIALREAKRERDTALVYLDKETELREAAESQLPEAQKKLEKR